MVMLILASASSSVRSSNGRHKSRHQSDATVNQLHEPTCRPSRAEILMELPPNSSHVPAVVANRVLVQIVGYVEHLWVSAGVRRRSSGASRSHAPAWALPQIPLTSPPPRACRPEPDPTASHRVWQSTREASRPRTCRLFTA